MTGKPLTKPPGTGNPFSGFTDTQLSILNDMLDEWVDKDRHGLLVSEHGYEADDLRALTAISETLYAERKKRGLTFF